MGQQNDDDDEQQPPEEKPMTAAERQAYLEWLRAAAKSGDERWQQVEREYQQLERERELGISGENGHDADGSENGSSS